jgi:hypothetical protein
MKRIYPTLVLLASAAMSSQAFAASADRPAVLELFTSQGCSSCPPADANVRLLADRPDVLALTFDVTYWDNQGWKDTFDKPEFTQRQDDYETPLREHGKFTPQIVIDGQKDITGIERRPLEDLVNASHRNAGPTMQLSANKISIGAGDATAAQVWLVRYDPRVQSVAPQAGENSGATLKQKNVVHSLTLLGEWKGTAQDFSLPPENAGLKTAVLVQRGKGGPILAAARD